VQTHAAKETELLVDDDKVGSGRESPPWPDSVAEARCVGCIEGVCKRINNHS
jgi:hypothetical protein